MDRRSFLTRVAAVLGAAPLIGPALSEVAPVGKVAIAAYEPSRYVFITSGYTGYVGVATEAITKDQWGWVELKS